MPYSNAYNGAVAAKVKKIKQAHISTENVINDNVQPTDPVTSHVESMALKHPDVTGGNGYAAATLGDLGYEPTLGTSSSVETKKPRRKSPQLEWMLVWLLPEWLLLALLVEGRNARSKEGHCLRYKTLTRCTDNRHWQLMPR